MITERRLPELRMYRRIEQSLPLEADDAYAPLVIARSNDTLPVHRWFRFKEAYSPDLLTEILPQLGLRGDIRILDPYCGVGTTLLAAQEVEARGRRIAAIGIERNPFLALVARTKAQWPTIDPDWIRDSGERLLEVLPNGESIPPLSGLTSGRCISRYMSQRLLAIRNSIYRRKTGPDRDALLVGLAAAIEPVSKVRKDGRMLRLVEKPVTQLNSVLCVKWDEMANDVEFLQDTLGNVSIPRVILGDGRRPTKAGIKPGTIDLILTSPPYPNNIDYSEVYKLELWLLGFIKTSEEFLKLRHSTFRSHPTTPSAEFPAALKNSLKSSDLGRLLRPILRRTKRASATWRHRLVSGYCTDLWNSLGEYYRCLRRGGYCVIVVGNSLHGGADSPYLIPTDLMICTMASELGFSVKKSVTARGLRRRLPGNHFLRDSVVVLKKARG